MSAVEVFQFPATGNHVRTCVVDGDPWFVAADVCFVLGYGGGARNAVQRLPERMKGVEEFNTPGGPQRLTIVNEAGVYRLVMRSTLPGAEGFQDWLAEEVVPAIRRTGSYNAVAQIPQSFAAALRLAADEHERAEREAAKVAELAPRAATLDAIEGGDGLTLRAFHKKYFSDVRERAFFEHLYARGYLIDQRGKGAWSNSKQKFRDGAQHGHPGFKGKPYLYLHTVVDDTETRRENTRVRPGAPEVTFRDRLAREGLPANTNNAIERKSA